MIFAPLRTFGVAWTILRRPFVQSRRILRSCVASGAENPEHFESFWLGAALNRLGTLQKWHSAQRISTASRSASLASPAPHFMCSSMANTPESKQCIRSSLLPARDCHALPLRHRRDGVLDAIAAPRRRPLLLRRQGRLRVVAGALRRAGQHNFRI